MIKTPVVEDYPPRAISTQEELRLWLVIQLHNVVSKDEMLIILKKPEFDALKLLSDGHASIFKEIMDLLEKYEVWDTIYTISQEVFKKGLEFMAKRKEAEAKEIESAKKIEALKKEEKSKSDQQKKTELNKAKMKSITEFTTTKAEELSKAKEDAESLAFCSAVMDWSLWKQFIRSASYRSDDKK
jgi:hypothetical protein